MIFSMNDKTLLWMLDVDLTDSYEVIYQPLSDSDFTFRPNVQSLLLPFTRANATKS